MKNRRVFIQALAATVLTGASATLLAQASPTGPMRLIVPWPAGGNADVVARVVAAKLGENLGRSIVIENRTGAAGNIGMEVAARQPKNGSTLALVITANTVNVSLYPKLGFDLVADFAPIGAIATLPLILVVNPSVPANSVQELIALARQHPGQLNYASGGNGTLGHLAAEMFKAEAKIDMVHVPYKGATPAIQDLLGGRVQVFFDGMPSSLPHVQAGQIRVLAITTAKRSPALPNVPTVAESGLPNFEVDGWFGLLAPAGTDTTYLNQVNTELNRALADPVVKKRLADLGLDTMADTPAQFGSMVKTEIAKWGKVVKTANIRID